MKTVNYRQVLIYHNKLVEATGGSAGVKEAGLIKSALERHKATFDGEDLYPTILDKISATTVSLVRNHGFVDGNKRIGVSVMLLLLRLNDMNIKYSQCELVNLGVSLASNQIDEISLKEWLGQRLV